MQACHQQADLRIEQPKRAQKRTDAATYNVQLGLAYLKQDDRPRAKRKLLTALDLAPHSPEVNAAMAYYLEKTGEINKARLFYQKALAYAPNSGAQLNNYGTFLCRQGNYQEAERYFLKAVKDVRYVNTAGAYENAGLCTAAIPDYDKAKHYFAKALEQDSRRKQALYELVTIELKENQVERALMNLQKYPEIVLHDARFLSLAVDASHRAGKTEVEAAYQLRLMDKS